MNSAAIEHDQQDTGWMIARCEETVGFAYHSPYAIQLLQVAVRVGL